MTVNRYRNLHRFRVVAPADHWPKPGGPGSLPPQSSETRDLFRPPESVRPLEMKRIRVGHQTYVAYDAHSLLEHEDYGRLARPGHPLG